MKYSVPAVAAVFGIWVFACPPIASAGELATAPTLPPEELARQAFLKGGIAYLRVPACVDSVPLDRGTKKALAPQRILATCKDLENERISEIRKREAFARRYNNAMFDMRSKAGKN